MIGMRLILDVTQKCFRAVNRPSGPDFGLTATGKAPESGLRPVEGRPEGRFRPGSGGSFNYIFYVDFTQFRLFRTFRFKFQLWTTKLSRNDIIIQLFLEFA